MALSTGLLAIGILIVVSCDKQHYDRQKNLHGSYTFSNYGQNGENNLHCNGTKYPWSRPYPIPLYLHESFPKEFVPILKNAINQWESTIQKALFTLQEEIIESSKIPEPNDDKNVIYWVTTTDSHLAYSEQGRVEYTLNSHDQVLEADMLINASFKNFQFFINNPNSTNDVHLESLFIHELGHMLGLKHSSSESSVMKSHLKANEKRTKISSEDIEQFNCN